jgi:hypothetical protein
MSLPNFIVVDVRRPARILSGQAFLDIHTDDQGTGVLSLQRRQRIPFSLNLGRDVQSRSIRFA